MKEAKVHYDVSVKDERQVALCNATGHVACSWTLSEVTCENCLRDPYFAIMRVVWAVGELDLR